RCGACVPRCRRRCRWRRARNVPWRCDRRWGAGGSPERAGHGGAPGTGGTTLAGTARNGTSPRARGSSFGSRARAEAGAWMRCWIRPHIPGRRHALSVRMNNPVYIELHARSAFSFLRGGSVPEELSDRAGALGIPAVGVCDRMGVYGAPRMAAAGRETGVRAIHGAELVMEDDTVFPVLVGNRSEERR